MSFWMDYSYQASSSALATGTAAIDKWLGSGLAMLAESVYFCVAQRKEHHQPFSCECDQTNFQSSSIFDLQYPRHAFTNGLVSMQRSGLQCPWNEARRQGGGLEAAASGGAGPENL